MKQYLRALKMDCRASLAMTEKVMISSKNSIFVPSLRGTQVTKQSSTDIASSFLRLEDGLPRFARNDGNGNYFK